MWEDVLSIVDDETSNNEGRLFVQEDSWDGSQYIRWALLAVSCHNNVTEQIGVRDYSLALGASVLSCCCDVSLYMDSQKQICLEGKECHRTHLANAGNPCNVCCHF